MLPATAFSTPLSNFSVETTVSKFGIIHVYGPESDATASHSFMQMLQGSTFMEKLNEDETP